MRPRLDLDLLRAFLVIGLLPYGVEKILWVQFAGAATLAERTVRSLDGMELIWAFFGYSRAYQIAVGVLQTAACLLLVPRRSAPIGAALYVALLTNVVLIDLCFGVQLAATLWASLLLVGCLVWIAGSWRAYQNAIAAVTQTAPPDAPLPAGKAYPFLVALLALVVWLSLQQISRGLIP